LLFQLNCRVESELETFIRVFLRKPSDNKQSVRIIGMSFTLKMNEKFILVNMTGSYVHDCTYTSAATTECQRPNKLK
jgi:hypothetical protein